MSSSYELEETLRAATDNYDESKKNSLNIMARCNIQSTRDLFFDKGKLCYNIPL